MTETPKPAQRAKPRHAAKGKRPLQLEIPPAKAAHTVYTLTREIVFLAVVSLVLAVSLKSFVTQAFEIPTGSMISTIQPGDRVMARRFNIGPDGVKRGDIVVFKDSQGWLGDITAPRNWFTRFMAGVGLIPEVDEHLAKRIIALSGDHVMCCSPNGKLMVNGVEIDEPYLDPGTAPSLTYFDLVVPEGHMWVMGDNRARSGDSRAHMDSPTNGAVPLSDVEGIVYATFWPLNRFAWHSNPGNFNHVPPADSRTGQ
ncbi:MAG: signal peptidase I [Buchananella hordeovulneris]|nr:signal peptidase I [Buchananella hordeovulneris]